MAQGRTHEVPGTGQQYHQFAAAVRKGAPVRHRVGHAAVKIGHAVHPIRFAGDGQTTGGLHNGIVVPLHVGTGKVVGQPGPGVGGHHHILAGGGGEGVVVDGVLATGVAEGGINVVHVQIRALFQQIGKAHILPPVRVIHVKALIASALERQVGH